MQILIHIIALFFIWNAVDYKRVGESKITAFSKEYFIQLALVTIGYVIICATY